MNIFSEVLYPLFITLMTFIDTLYYDLFVKKVVISQLPFVGDVITFLVNDNVTFSSIADKPVTMFSFFLVLLLTCSIPLALSKLINSINPLF